ncbi:hypothetical protein CDL15_Pgr022133 [Punica granatum]|uniref:Glutaredoxin domain-containing protein n=1 Tax=Punica granatum TaxID=22663 RepID=A0A218VT55_PUNGR|nr:hypothetical protein CDL15_Pgr022133 [Punica granatum]PKI70664.1 hypothetical protein CRG98_008897 [Punica granatum]
MQGVQRRHCSDEIVRLDLGSGGSAASSASASCSLSIDDDESTEARIQRLISEHPVIIFSRSACCMCHVMKRLFSTLGVHPAVIELDDSEISALPSSPAPAVFIGGTPIGGLESLVALHLSNRLVPKLIEAGALWP